MKTVVFHVFLGLSAGMVWHITGDWRWAFAASAGLNAVVIALERVWP